MRIDKYLAEHSLAESRQKAKELISGGFVTLNGKIVSKDSTDVGENDRVEVTGRPYPYVSRGGLKLEAAKSAFSLDFTNKIACDLGASTGGFTDLMLRSGVRRVYAVDCGKGQLHPDIASDPRVVNMEGINARELSANDLGTFCDVVVSDLSFISQTLVFESVTKILSDKGEFVSLIKPQFEAGRENISKGGIVKDPHVHISVIKHVTDVARMCQLYCIGLIRSPIRGGDGNAEYLAHFRYLRDGSDILPLDISEICDIVLKGKT